MRTFFRTPTPSTSALLVRFKDPEHNLGGKGQKLRAVIIVHRRGFRWSERRTRIVRSPRSYPELPRAIDSLKLLVTQSPQAPARNNSHCLTRRPCRSLALFARSNFRPSRDDETRLRHLAFTASRTARCN